MKKLIIIMLALLFLTGLVAVELKYWVNEAYLQRIPRTYTAGDQLLEVATVFTPPSDCVLQNVSFPYYLAGAVGLPSVSIGIWPVDASGLPNKSGGFPLASSVVTNANLINWATAGAYNVVDFSGSNLNFGPTGTNGTAFAMIMSCPGGIVGTLSTATLHDDASRGNSYNYYTYPPPGWLGTFLRLLLLC